MFPTRSVQQQQHKTRCISSSSNSSSTMSGCSRPWSSSRIARLMSQHSSRGGPPGLRRVETDVQRRWAYPGTLSSSSSRRWCIAAEPEPKASRRSYTKKASASASRRPSMLHTARRKAWRDRYPFKNAGWFSRSGSFFQDPQAATRPLELESRLAKVTIASFTSPFRSRWLLHEYHQSI
jgi:hypothetical protein